VPKLFYKDLWGRRQAKYSFLETNDVATVDWQELNTQEPYYFFVPKDFSLKEEYEKFIALTDIFQEFNVGTATGKDSVLVDFQKNSVYAVLYSPAYRKKYQEFLKIDFPRIPLPENQLLFENLSKLGKRLVDLHLLKSEILSQQFSISVGYPVQGNDRVERVKYSEGRVYISNSQYFDGIPPDIWNYHIGSYQVLEKFLKDRKGRSLSLEEKQRYMKIVSVIACTIGIQQEIDRY
jgi:hypothetical protein